MTWWYPYSCAIPGEPNLSGVSNATFSQHVPLAPFNDRGEQRPIAAAAAPYDRLFSAYYRTPFIYDIGNDGSLPWSSVVTWFRRPAAGNTVYIWHYQPFAWNGTPPEVFAAILLQMGLPSAYIDQTAFTNAHTRYGAVGGDEPWVASAGHTTRNSRQIYCWRRVGQKLIDLLMEVARHGRDMYYTNEAGIIDVSSFTSPEEVVLSLDLDDGVLDVEWEIVTDLIFNSVRATWGHGFRAWGGVGDPPDATGYNVNEEPTLDSYIGNKYVHEVSNAASVARFGELPLGNTRRQTVGSGAAKEMIVAHYPFYLDPGATDAGWAAGEGGMQHVAYWLASDSKSRRMLTVRQDLRALDWGIGALVESVAVTDDGQTIDEAWCVEREYDFNRLVVTSVLMERPPNT